MQRERLAEAVPHWLDRIEWLDRLPDSPVDAVVIGNELLDAMPVHRFRRQDGAWLELHVTCDGDVFGERWLPLVHAALGEALDVIWPDARDVSDGYASEINLRLRPWFAALAGSLARACVLLIDYGYTRREYYHPERDRGTLICHFRHRAHTDPYLLPGLQDLTANVDFTAVAEAAAAAGFALSGYTTQANFLLANGLDRRVADAMTGDDHARVRLLQGVKQLTLPSEMGERFKVIGFARGCEPQMTGFHLRDLRDRL
jgi:SAM-dependent MidA family methyltransferase